MKPYVKTTLELIVLLPDEPLSDELNESSFDVGFEEDLFPEE